MGAAPLVRVVHGAIGWLAGSVVHAAVRMDERCKARVRSRARASLRCGAASRIAVCWPCCLLALPLLWLGSK